MIYHAELHLRLPVVQRVLSCLFWREPDQYKVEKRHVINN